MKNTTIRRGLLAAAVPLVGLLAYTNIAGAGHTNTLLETSLNGRNEVDPNGSRRIVGDRDGRGEAYVFGIDGDSKTLCYVLTVERIEPATMAHIHRGAAGTNGPVVVNLAAPADGNSADCLTEGEILPSGAPAFPDPAGAAPPATVAEILMNPSNFYVNVHNTPFPAGAIRGQLQPQS